eukprot:CAMPEP_0116130016 /NCGR_PEP_ID=MMETSP0329-20121206/8232_1 /TAXON_ID=697910 /ORGANISM="Pseudo-nitzschia arenysensis, Strain B593" /LENGTH=281 /DNA_ID=CAMNT_0003624321 /DNA_START=197 /DNA_END=1042 /DNA_ORIENTATION=+
MSCSKKLILGNTYNKAFQAPINAAANKILNNSRNGAIKMRITTNRRTMSSFASQEGIVGSTNNTVDAHGNSANVPQQQQRQQQQFSRFQRLHSPELSWKRLGSANDNHNIGSMHRRSMVTITQTKSSDSGPLFSADVVDDVSLGSAPTYVVNEDTNLIVTENCLKQVERLMKQRESDDGHFLRVFVDAGGCSGFQYQFEVDNDLDEDEDIVVIMAKADDTMKPRVVVDETSMGFLEGSTIDYVIEMIKSAFVVTDNPQSESACGCGSSFAMKNFEKFGAKD